MEIQTLHIFVKVVHTGSFTKAAEALGSQKAHLSRVISQLEKDLGVRLLERTTRALSLTEVGREFFEHAKNILAAVEAAEQAVQKAHSEPVGVLKLTTSEALGQMVVNRWLDGYLQCYPKVKIEADFTNRIVDLVHEGFDLAVRVGQLHDSGLIARKLGDIRYGIFAAPAYLETQGEPISLADLRRHQILSYQGSHEKVEWAFEQNGQTQRLTLNPRLKVNSVLAVRDLVVAGQGLAMLPELVVSDGLHKLTKVLPTWFLPTTPVHAVYASAKYLTPKVRAFVDMAVEHLAKRSPFV